jgi:hypothetical protein
VFLGRVAIRQQLNLVDTLDMRSRLERHFNRPAPPAMARGGYESIEEFGLFRSGIHGIPATCCWLLKLKRSLTDLVSVRLTLSRTFLGHRSGAAASTFRIEPLQVRPGALSIAKAKTANIDLRASASMNSRGRKLGRAMKVFHTQEISRRMFKRSSNGRTSC